MELVWDWGGIKGGGGVRDQAVGAAVAKGDHGEGHEGGDRVADVGPVYACDLADHHAANLLGKQRVSGSTERGRGEGLKATHQNQRAPRRPRRDRRQERRKEQRHQETAPRHNRRQARPPSLHDSRAALDEGSDGRDAEQGADRDADGVAAEGDGGAREVGLLAAGAAAEARHRVERRRAVDDVDVQEGEDGDGEARARLAAQVPLLLRQRVPDRVERDNLGEVVEAPVAVGGVGEVGERGVATAGACEYGVGEGFGEGTYGHERMETRAMPMMMAPLTRNAMRMVVSKPPQTIPIHI